MEETANVNDANGRAPYPEAKGFTSGIWAGMWCGRPWAPLVGTGAAGPTI
jgi:hypothetical protein